jgi:ubiquinone/menaquinone biosynthesis C-methylase UbiE/uncharacterized protein YbaR (Trm112 family)
MLASFAPNFLRCPSCRRDRTLSLRADESDEREVRTGTLTCSACAATFEVQRGTGQLMPDPPEHVAREAAGLGRFADYMRVTGWTKESILQLPDHDDGYWYVQGASIRQLIREIPFSPGQWLLDIGSNTCWASNFFARHDLQVIALDISLWEMQGLYTADYFIEDGLSYFERVLGSMNDMPIAANSLDYVYACEVLHHNDSEGLRRTFEEAYRVLKPGGRMLVVNETLKTINDPVGVHTEAVEQFEGYEHAHWASQYRWAAIRAGFSTRLIEPCYHGYFNRPTNGPKPGLTDLRARASYELRSTTVGRKALLSYINHVAGGTAFGMVATKPNRRSLPRVATDLTGRMQRAGR